MSTLIIQSSKIIQTQQLEGIYISCVSKKLTRKSQKSNSFQTEFARTKPPNLLILGLAEELKNSRYVRRSDNFLKFMDLIGEEKRLERSKSHGAVSNQ